MSEFTHYLCGRCWRISPIDSWTYLKPDLDADDPRAVPIQLASGEYYEDAIICCPHCGCLHDDDDSAPGVWDGTLEEVEATRAREIIDCRVQVCAHGHAHVCPECEGQHFMEGGFHPDCDGRGLAHVWSEWHTNNHRSDLTEDRYCERCGVMERQRLTA